jgi:arsenate reductase (thioredoxin)
MQGKFSILFLCTWNAGRSIFAEYFMKELGAAKFDAFSAGANPRGKVSPVTLKILKERYRLDASDARSKSWHEFQDKELDFIVSVSDQAEEVTQAFPGKPILANWPFPDPSQVQGSAEEIEHAYFQVASRIRYRLELFNNLSFDKLDRLRLELKMKEMRESSERLGQVLASQNENSALREDIRKLILLLERLRVLCSSIKRNSEAQENAYREVVTLLDEMRRRYNISPYD